MKKLFLVVWLAFVGIAFAQNAPEFKDWFHQDFEKTGVRGVGTNEALEFLKSKGLKPTPIVVAVIDGGVEPDHEDLAANMWKNPKEIPGNGKDDDKNGYIDDVFGWNFIGGKNGNVNVDTYEMVRVIKEYKPLFEGEKANENKKLYPDKFKTYERAQKEYNEKLDELGGGAEQMEMVKQQLEEQLGKPIKAVLGNLPITEENINNIKPKDQKEERIKTGLLQMLQQTPEINGKTADQLIAFITEEMEEEIGGSETKKQQLSMTFDPRDIVGDNYADKTEKFYGNNDVEGPDGLHGTHVAGIIAAVRNNKKGMDGVAGDVAKIMAVRVVPDGDERDKDVANGIRYAVDNGAKILNMSFGKGYSLEKEIVWEAMKYAESKGVLMVHAAGNDNKNLDVEYNYPTNFKEGEKKSFVNNWVTVGASTRYPDNLKASFSNYGSYTVDIFAPGLEIYSTAPDSKYRTLQGTSMAAPVFSGCAAVLWSYFPHLTAQQVKEILLSTADVDTSIINLGDEKMSFDSLSVSGGTVNLHKAVRLAWEKYRKK